jgi:hypothetical protein
MSFTDKFEKLEKNSDVVKAINKQLMKRNLVPKKAWWKEFRINEMYSSDTNDFRVYYCTLFHVPTKSLVTTSAFCHDVDDFNLTIGGKICYNRMADSLDFQKLAVGKSVGATFIYTIRITYRHFTAK